jgi:serine/threonine-protein kinase HipA
MRLRVSLHGATVGHLERQESGLITFRFDPGYLDMADRPVLGRWYEDHLAPDFVEKGVQGQLPPFFHNYLPEPNSALRELLARRARVPTNRDFALLAVLGEDLPGAVLVEPVGDRREDDAVDSVKAAPTDHAPDGPLRFSLAGMQLKFSVAQQANKLTLPVTGIGGRFILKMPSRELANVPANELSMMTWARASGISVPEVKLVRWRQVEGLPSELDFKEEDALLVSRFDRPVAGGRVHQEDFAQVLGKRPSDKYGREAEVTFDRIGKIIAQTCGEDDFVEFIRRLVFIVLCANPDAHLKNWSLIYPDRRRPRLAPAYDLVSTADYAHITTELAHRLADEWELGRVDSSHFGKLASRAGFDPQRGVDWARNFAVRARKAWTRLRRELPLSPEQRAAIDKHLRVTRLP